MRVGQAVTLRIAFPNIPNMTGEVIKWDNEKGIIDSDLISDDAGLFRVRITIDLTKMPAIVSKVDLLSVSYAESGEITSIVDFSDDP